MAEDGIKQKELWRGLNNINQADWIKAGYKLHLAVVESKSGTSHYVTLRDPKNSDPDDIQGLITTLTPNTYKQANGHIFKAILNFGKKNTITEDDIWRALGKL